jgi:hypothetical protein
MILNGGELDGVRLLEPDSVALMRTNTLNEQTLNSQSALVRCTCSLPWDSDTTLR